VYTEVVVTEGTVEVADVATEVVAIAAEVVDAVETIVLVDTGEPAIEYVRLTSVLRSQRGPTTRNYTAGGHGRHDRRC